MDSSALNFQAPHREVTDHTSELADSMSDFIKIWREAEQHILIHRHSFPWRIFQRTLVLPTAVWGVWTPWAAPRGSLKDVYKAAHMNAVTSIFLHAIAARMSDQEATQVII